MAFIEGEAVRTARRGLPERPSCLLGGRGSLSGGLLLPGGELCGLFLLLGNLLGSLRSRSSGFRRGCRGGGSGKDAERGKRSNECAFHDANLRGFGALD